MKQTEIEGWGSLEHLRDILEKMEAKEVFLVTGNRSYTESGARKSLDALLREYTVTRFCGFSAERSPEAIEKGVRLLSRGGFDVVVAIGGGTAIDMAKMINIFAANREEIRDYIQKKSAIEEKGLPLIAIPTTSGSGSESTHFAVTFIDKIKYSVAHEYMLPDYSIVDASLTASLPGHITASTGLDALAQSIESYWSINSTDESRAYSEEALKLVLKHLVDAVKRPDRRSRKAMAKASHLAGKAINIAKTTAPHAVSYYFTAHHNIPHGHAVGLTLGRFIRFNSLVGAQDVADTRGLDFVRHTISNLLGLLGVTSGAEAMRRVDGLMQDIGLETDVRKMGLTGGQEAERLIKSVNRERLQNNPRRVEPRDIPGIIGAA